MLFALVFASPEFSNEFRLSFSRQLCIVHHCVLCISFRLSLSLSLLTRPIVLSFLSSLSHLFIQHFCLSTV